MAYSWPLLSAALTACSSCGVGYATTSSGGHLERARAIGSLTRRRMRRMHAGNVSSRERRRTRCVHVLALASILLLGRSAVAPAESDVPVLQRVRVANMNALSALAPPPHAPLPLLSAPQLCLMKLRWSRWSRRHSGARGSRRRRLTPRGPGDAGRGRSGAEARAGHDAGRATPSGVAHRGPRARRRRSAGDVRRRALWSGGAAGLARAVHPLASVASVRPRGAQGNPDASSFPAPRRARGTPVAVACD